MRLTQGGRFVKYLKSRKIKESTREEYVAYVKKIDGFALNEKGSSGIGTSFLKDVQAFLKQWQTDKKEKQVFLYALKSYGRATGNLNLMANVNRLLARAMDVHKGYGRECYFEFNFSINTVFFFPLCPLSHSIATVSPSLLFHTHFP